MNKGDIVRYSHPLQRNQAEMRFELAEDPGDERDGYVHAKDLETKSFDLIRIEELEVETPAAEAKG